MKAISVRLPDALHDEIAALADFEVRSVAGQALALLREALAARKQRLPGEQSTRSAS